jgi:hypothetical protein
MKSHWCIIPTVLIAMVFMVMSGCGSGSGSGNGGMMNLSNSASSTYTISGAVMVNGVGLGGVTVTLSGSVGTYTGSTDSTGKYTISRVKNGNYTAIPTLAGYSFTPENQAIVVNGANATIDDFTAAELPKFTISGNVTVNGVGLGGVTVTFSGSGGSYAGTTDSSGKYTVSAPDGNYTASPVLSGYSFTPENQTIAVNGADATISNFAATLLPASKVYVIAKSLGSVMRINANTLAVEKTINLGVSSLNSIAVIDDMLWYCWGDQGAGYIGRYNLTTDVNETKVIGYTINSIDVYAGSLLRTTPTQPGILYVGAQDVSPANIQKIDISVNPPVLLARTEHGPMGSNLGDFKISEDGTKIWSASGSPYSIVEIRTSDLVLSGTTFDTGPYPTAVDRTTVNGSEVVVGGIDDSNGNDIFVFKASDPSIMESYQTGTDSLRGDIAVNASATRIYAVHTKSDSTSELVTVASPTGVVNRTNITTSSTFNSGIGVDNLTGRVFVATLNSVGVFDSGGNAIGNISSIAGASTILVVAP